MSLFLEMRVKMEDIIDKVFEKVRKNCHFFEEQLAKLIGEREILVWGGVPRDRKSVV